MALGKKLKLEKLIPLINLSEDEVLETTQYGTTELDSKEKDSTEIAAVSEDIRGFSFLDSIETNDLRIEFVPSKRKTQKKIFVHMSGSLTINNVSEMKNRIPHLFDDYDHIELVLKDVTSIDITAIQLFNLMRVNYHSFGKFTYINAELSAEQKKMLNTCGFSEFNTQVAASV